MRDLWRRILYRYARSREEDEHNIYHDQYMMYGKVVPVIINKDNRLVLASLDDNKDEACFVINDVLKRIRKFCEEIELPCLMLDNKENIDIFIETNTTRIDARCVFVFYPLFMNAKNSKIIIKSIDPTYPLDFSTLIRTIFICVDRRFFSFLYNEISSDILHNIMNRKSFVDQL